MGNMEHCLAGLQLSTQAKNSDFYLFVINVWYSSYLIRNEMYLNFSKFAKNNQGVQIYSNRLSDSLCLLLYLTISDYI